MVIIRALFYFLAERNINIRLEHIHGYINVKADHLSRLQVDRFRRLAPMAEEGSSNIPQ